MDEKEEANQGICYALTPPELPKEYFIVENKKCNIQCGDKVIPILLPQYPCKKVDTVIDSSNPLIVRSIVNKGFVSFHGIQGTYAIEYFKLVE